MTQTMEKHDHDMIAEDRPTPDPVIESHLVAYTKIGDWRMLVSEEVNDETGEMLERTWIARRSSGVPGLADETEWADDLLSLSETLIDTLPHRERDGFDAYLVVGDLMHQMYCYWSDRALGKNPSSDGVILSSRQAAPIMRSLDNMRLDAIIEGVEATRAGEHRKAQFLRGKSEGLNTAIKTITTATRP